MVNDLRANFLKMIRESPDSDGPRLVYCDWLEEQGETDFAEFIRSQIELYVLDRTSCDSDETCVCNRSQELRDRERMLLAAHGEEWTRAVMPAGTRYLAPYDCDISDGHADNPHHGWVETSGGYQGHAVVEFVRGFVGRVRIWWAGWLAHANTILAGAPVTEVTLTTWPQIHQDLDTGKWSFTGGRPEGRLLLVVDNIRYIDRHVELLRIAWPAIKTWYLPRDPHVGIPTLNDLRAARYRPVSHATLGE